MPKKNLAEKYGKEQANAIMRAANLTYNAPRGRKMVKVCIKTLQKRIHEIQPQKADKKYYEDRYNKKNKKKGGDSL